MHDANAEIRRLQDALKPFAEAYAKMWRPKFTRRFDQIGIWTSHDGETRLTLEHFKIAAEALEDRR